eukprot:53308_1
MFTFSKTICFLLTCWMSSALPSVNVTCTLTNIITNTTSDSFISFNMDYGDVHRDIDWTNETFIYLSKQLSPSYLRIGGTSSDYVYYEVGDENPCKLPPPSKEKYTCLSMEAFTDLVTFANTINTKLIYSISAGYPLFPTNISSYWNSSNALQFLQYLHDTNKYNENNIYGFGLGNELNKGEPFTNATWQINAFKKLNNLLENIWGTNHSFKLLGPDPHSATVENGTNHDFEYLQQFYIETCDILHLGDYHVYIDLAGPESYLTPSGLNQQYFQSSRVMNDINWNINECMKELKNNILAGEIGAVNGNGEYNVSFSKMLNKYWDGFWWLDAAGIVSKIGQKAGLRWVLYQTVNNASSLNKNLLGYDFVPNPDYYTTLLYKYIMSIYVLDIKSDNEYFRIYSHCTSENINKYIYNDSNLDLINAVSMNYIALFNNNDYEYVNIYLDNINDLLIGDVILWSLLPSNKSMGIQSSSMLLNDVLLVLTNDKKLPSLKGKVINVNKENGFIQIPSLTYGFIVFTKTNIDACSITNRSVFV